ncbi:MAG: hypothetical protein CL424_16620 [Acidimicrobiaceae bacterium]|nr:hypothetical protein [Acidimicrobiaceae bacterium]
MIGVSLFLLLVVRGDVHPIRRGFDVVITVRRGCHMVSPAPATGPAGDVFGNDTTVVVEQPFGKDRGNNRSISGHRRRSPATITATTAKRSRR